MIQAIKSAMLEQSAHAVKYLKVQGLKDAVESLTVNTKARLERQIQ